MKTMKLCAAACLLIILVVLLPGVDGRSSGAPQSACGTFTPQHGTNVAQTSASPYSITFTPTTFTAGGGPITVTLTVTSGSTTFKGFLLAAQYDESCVDQTLMPGSFTPIGNTQQNCNNGAITHSAHNTLNSLSFQWTPPATSQGHIRFRATFVESFNKFWVDVKSASVLTDSAMSANQSACTSPASGTQPPATIGSITKDAQCGKTKGCYSDCSGTDCQYLMTWAEGTTNDSIRITMSGKVGTAQKKYIAVGLSNDKNMGDDSVHYCYNDGTGTGVFSSYNNGKDNVWLTNNKDGLGDISVSLTDGILSCSFTRSKTSGSDNRLFPLDKRYTLFWAEGTASAFGISRHDSLPVASDTEASLLDFTEDLGGGALEFPLIKAHGSLMMAAWIFCASIGIVLARYYKNEWQDSKWCGEKVWFQIHRTCMVLCFAATVAAFIIIFVEVEGYSEIEGEDYQKAHPITGIIVTCLAVINPIMALFRPHPGTKNRPIFNWLHWAVGMAAYILAILTVFFGLKLHKAGAPAYVIYILVAFVIWQFLVQVLLEFLQCQARSNADGGNKYEMTDVTQGTPPSQSPSNQGSQIKPIILGVHILVVAAFTITLIVVLNVAEHDH